MSQPRLLVPLLFAGAVLGAIAWKARARDYVVGAPAGTFPVRLEGEVPDGCEVRVFEVDGICCGGCAAKLHDAVAMVEGVRRLAVDPATKEVQVLVRAEVDPERLTQALTFDEYVAHPRATRP